MLIVTQLIKHLCSAMITFFELQCMQNISNIQYLAYLDQYLAYVFYAGPYGTKYTVALNF